MENNKQSTLLGLLNDIKTSLVHTRLYLCARQRQSGDLFKITYTYVLGRYAMVETQIAFLQQKLSHLCGLVYWLLYKQADLTNEKINEKKSEIKTCIDQLPTDFDLSLTKDLSMERIDPFFFTKKAKELAANTSIEIAKNRDGLAHYSGLKVYGLHKPVDYTEIETLLNKIKQANINNINGMYEILNLIGAKEAIDVSNLQNEIFNGVMNGAMDTFRYHSKNK